MARTRTLRSGFICAGEENRLQTSDPVLGAARAANLFSERGVLYFHRVGYFPFNCAFRKFRRD